MFDWISIEYYSAIYYYVLLIILFISILYLEKYGLVSKSNILTVNVLGIFLLILSVVYMGLRPINGVFLDMKTYNNKFLKITNLGIEAIGDRDLLFYYFTYLCTLVMSNKIYFLLLAFLYVYPMYKVAKVNFKKGYFYILFLFMASFSFWAYGTNGLRNGLATSVFLLVFITNNKYKQLLILFIAYNLHSSMLIPIIAFVGSYFIKDVKYLLIGWIISIPISLLFGDALQFVFADLMQDDRTSYLTIDNLNKNNKFSSVGFRWDFVLYSASAVFAGWYYIFKKNFKDNRYHLIYGTYLIANAFWIIVIKANYSNRFAYLSWFLMALVIGYPLFKQHMFNNQNRVILYILLAYFGFTFLMNIIL